MLRATVVVRYSNRAAQSACGLWQMVLPHGGWCRRWRHRQGMAREDRQRERRAARTPTTAGLVVAVKNNLLLEFCSGGLFHEICMNIKTSGILFYFIFEWVYLGPALPVPIETRSKSNSQYQVRFNKFVLPTAACPLRPLATTICRSCDKFDDHRLRRVNQVIWPNRIISAQENGKLVSPWVYADNERAEGCSAVLLLLVLHAKPLETSFFLFIFFFSFIFFYFFFLLIFFWIDGIVLHVE